jgi:hypothetical protein
MFLECETRLGPNGKGEPIANICLFANTNLQNFKIIFQGAKGLLL